MGNLGSVWLGVDEGWDRINPGLTLSLIFWGMTPSTIFEEYSLTLTLDLQTKRGLS
jgi:hypothetical protein